MVQRVQIASANLSTQLPRHHQHRAAATTPMVLQQHRAAATAQVAVSVWVAGMFCLGVGFRV